MSSALAIAAVTASLKDLLNDGLMDHDLSSMGSFAVTAQPPDRVTTGSTEHNQLNLFLYQVTANGGWRNVDLPSRDRSGRPVTNPPLALDLHYLLTAYGAQDLNAEILLGYAMQVLHETPVLTRQQLRTALGSPPPVDGTLLPGPFGSLSAIDLADQVEQIKLTPVYLGSEDLSKLWTAMQARYRPSMAYAVSVVLIQRQAAGRAALPVLRRGADDRGPVVHGSPAPLLTGVRADASPLQPALRLGEDFLVNGSNLLRGNVAARVEHARFGIVRDLVPVPVNNDQLSIHLPSVPEDATGMDAWSVGVYSVSLRVAEPNLPVWGTNSVVMALAPQIGVSPLAHAPGTINLSVTCTPRLRTEQHAQTRLLFGAIEVLPDSIVTPADTTQSTSLTFTIPNVAAGDYPVRLRVEGIDSLPDQLLWFAAKVEVRPATDRERNMSGESWRDNNQRYLAASLQWLRLRLQRLVSPPAPPATVAGNTIMVMPAPGPPPADVPAWPTARSWFARKAVSAPTMSPSGPATVAEVLEPPSPGSTRDPQALANAAAERDAAAQCDPLPALLLLAQRFRLSPFERDTILMCAAAELDPGIGALFAAAQGHAARTYPTFALALHAFDDPTWDSMSAQHPLRYARLIEVSHDDSTSMTAGALRADERIVNYLKGLNILDERLAMLVTAPSAVGAAGLSPSQQAVADEALARLRGGAPDAVVPSVQLAGIDVASKLAVAREVCRAIDRQLYRMPLESLPTQRAEIETLVRLWQRESVLLPVALYIDADGLDGAPPELSAALNAFVAREPGLLFVGLREPSSTVPGAQPSFEVRKPTAAEQCWTNVLAATIAPDEAAGAARLLAGQFDLNVDDIAQAASVAQNSSADGQFIERAWDACRGFTRPKLDALAQRLEPKSTWDDLVLSDESLRLLQQIAVHMRGRFQVYEDWGYAKKMTRGFGLSALFAGESGTGKTMAAEVIANELRLLLYRIDLSAVVSKYIGETEKNLRRLFDAAEQGGAILLFDEADALFGKRSEVKDSHDRYANIEINYLLQRMETFSGLAILATNMKAALDPAFMRRLRFIVNFPFPGPAERQRLWRKVFPHEVPQQDLAYDVLARFSLSGGNIHSIALNAAFAAADRGGVITQPLLLSAVRNELRKLDKPVNEAEFR